MMVKFVCILLLYIGMVGFAAAQRDSGFVDLKVGDSVTLGTCSHAQYGFMGIDIVTKTRWVDRGIPYDSVSGAGFYYYFFNEGDFDSRRLGCEYSGKKFKVVGFQTVKEESGKERLIIFGRINNDPLTALWIEADEAIAVKELVF